jgi:phosphoglycolate phosphatase-like HAD superfamily hydrolase
MNEFRMVIFDVDGVLLDSLIPHLKICADKSREYELRLKIPDASAFKKIVRTGVKISPMKYMFMAVGFPESFAEKADEQYRKVFMQNYAPVPFPRVFETLRSLHEAGLQLGIVTSNVKKNVVEALGQSFSFFRPDCVFTKDEMEEVPKDEAIKAAITKAHLAPDDAIYVGDQRADMEAAQLAGVSFLGVTYGWGLSNEDTGVPLIRDICEVASYILASPRSR